MAEASPELGVDNSGSKALRNTGIVVLLLLLFTLRLYALPILALVAGLWLVRRLWRLNRTLGISLTTMIAIAACSYVVLIYSAERQHQQLLAELSDYPSASVSRDLFPLPYVYQLSIGPGIDDQALREILQTDGLDQITDLYLENSLLTDDCLNDVATFDDLNYVFLDCDGISDEAIVAFERRLPDCRVIAFQRDLHPNPDFSVRLGP
ncbi:hypothetical protein [Blastopirellula retiformator]|uniref:Uncharacterized protein n=1 Tax=Blastopirellula retiformator TaxID=2527970 RepID=A0A5C5UW36_9BACT|nr:hypothetical protein [Blastopirellula retiformator]TWT30594.1 hypothetical protein Enr8_41150 [Blastopirellula retiformator]